MTGVSWVNNIVNSNMKLLFELLLYSQIISFHLAQNSHYIYNYQPYWEKKIFLAQNWADCQIIICADNI